MKHLNNNLICWLQGRDDAQPWTDCNDEPSWLQSCCRDEDLLAKIPQLTSSASIEAIEPKEANTKKWVTRLHPQNGQSQGPQCPQTSFSKVSLQHFWAFWIAEKRGKLGHDACNPLARSIFEHVAIRPALFLIQHKLPWGGSHSSSQIGCTASALAQSNLAESV